MVSHYLATPILDPTVRRFFAPTSWVLLFFAVINGGAYLAAPALFLADAARGPFTLANNYELTRVYGRSYEGYQDVVRRFPESRYYDAARIGVANSLLGLGRRDEAIAEYQKLLTTLSEGEDRGANRLIVLSKLASTLEEAGDTEQFTDVYAHLAAEYPESAATAEAKRYADAIAASAASASGTQTNDESDLVQVELEPALAGKPFTMSIRVMPEAVATGIFSIAINSSFVSAFDVVSVKPATSGTTDYWGKRFFQLQMADAALDVVFTLKPKASGKYLLDLDLESNFTMIELNKTISVNVEGP